MPLSSKENSPISQYLDKYVFNRNVGATTNDMTQSFGAMGIAPAIAESIVFSLASGGATGMIWTYIAGCILLIPVALSLGELGSAMPTSGGLYFWVAHLSPPWCRAFMTWLAGYMNVLGYISIYASTCYAATLILVAAVSIGTDGVFTSSQYINYGIFAATVLVTFFMTSVSSKVDYCPSILHNVTLTCNRH